MVRATKRAGGSGASPLKSPERATARSMGQGSSSRPRAKMSPFPSNGACRDAERSRTAGSNSFREATVGKAPPRKSSAPSATASRASCSRRGNAMTPCRAGSRGRTSSGLAGSARTISTTLRTTSLASRSMSSATFRTARPRPTSPSWRGSRTIRPFSGSATSSGLSREIRWTTKRIIAYLFHFHKREKSICILIWTAFAFLSANDSSSQLTDAR